MPKASVNENNRLVFRQDNIGFAGQVFYMEAVTVAMSMKKTAHEHFGLGILALYPAHVVAARGLVMYVCHKVKLLPYNYVLTIIIPNAAIDKSSWVVSFSFRPLCHY